MALSSPGGWEKYVDSLMLTSQPRIDAQPVLSQYFPAPLTQLQNLPLQLPTRINCLRTFHPPCLKTISAGNETFKDLKDFFSS